MAMPDQRFEVLFDEIDAIRINQAAAHLGMTQEEFIRWATQRAIEQRLDDWLQFSPRAPS